MKLVSLFSLKNHDFSNHQTWLVKPYPLTLTENLCFGWYYKSASDGNIIYPQVTISEHLVPSAHQ